MNNWESKFVNFGVARPDGNLVKVYENKFAYVTLNAGSKVSYVTWAGDQLNVFLENGKVRRYKDKFSWVDIK